MLLGGQAPIGKQDARGRGRQLRVGAVDEAQPLVPELGGTFVAQLSALVGAAEPAILRAWSRFTLAPACRHASWPLPLVDQGNSAAPRPSQRVRGCYLLLVSVTCTVTVLSHC